MNTLKNMTGWQKFISGVIVGLIVGWGGTSTALHRGAPEDKMADKAADGVSKEDATAAVTDASGVSSDTAATGVMASGENSVSVKDQAAGSKVAVENATLSQMSWVVVHEQTSGMPGKILGAHRYDKGMYLAEVELLRPTVQGQTYYVMLHADDGDKEFDPTKDKPMLGADNKPIMNTFQAN
jgi:hypothetical protein